MISIYYNNRAPLLVNQVVGQNLINALATTIVERREPYPAKDKSGYTLGDLLNTIVPTYAVACAEVGLDLYLVLAQLLHETGDLTSWWSQRPRRNPAGIGVTGRSVSREMHDSYPDRFPDTRFAMGADGYWHEGISFASWQDAINAHTGRLLAYALKDAQAQGPQLPRIQAALALRPLPDKYRGCAPTLQGLAGTWANPGILYPQAIVRVANQLLDSVHRLTKEQV